MAENKKSVLLYCDLIHTVEELSDEEAGRLFKHYLRYINDKDPEAPDKLTQIVFEPIKQTLKRDLKKWEKSIEAKSKAGKKSADVRKANQHMLTGVDFVEQEPTESTVKDNVSVSDSVNEKVIENDVIGDKSPKQKIEIQEREQVFYKQISEFKNEYEKGMLRAFFDYWREPNKSRSKMRWEQERTWDLSLRLKRWSEHDKQNFKNGTDQQNNSNRGLGSKSGGFGVLVDLAKELGATGQ